MLFFPPSYADGLHSGAGEGSLFCHFPCCTPSAVKETPDSRAVNLALFTSTLKQFQNLLKKLDPNPAVWEQTTARAVSGALMEARLAAESQHAADIAFYF